MTLKRNVIAARKRDNRKKLALKKKAAWSIRPLKLPYEGAHLTDEDITAAVKKVLAA